MYKIHIPMKLGQELKPEVIAGITANQCSMIISTNNDAFMLLIARFSFSVLEFSAG